MPAILLVLRPRLDHAVPPADVYLAAALAAFIAFTHRANLSRLRQGREPAIGAARPARADRTKTGGRT